MMANTIRFVLGGEIREVPVTDPTQTVLQWLRANRRPGTKEGCADGDCGACTVVLGTRDPAAEGGIRYRAVNACIVFVPQLDGRQLITVEDLKPPGGELHPVQRALVDCHGSQCGFCTPGFVMSLFAEFHEGPQDPDRERLLDVLAGNLCRCTGYRPIVEAGMTMRRYGTGDAFDAARAQAAALLDGIRRTEDLTVTGAGRTFHAPRRLDRLARLFAAHPDATILAGGTDVGLWVTKQHRDLKTVISVSEVAGFAAVVERDGALQIGGGATYSDLLPAVDRHFPDFAVLLRRLGSVQIRNSGTMGGNVANGSPIGDSMPALIALGTTVVLNHGGTRREMPLEDLYLDYKEQARVPGELVEALTIPLDVPGRQFATYKVSKRLDQDISAVCAAYAITLSPAGKVATARIAYGGMAVTTRRAARTEASLRGRPWSLETVLGAYAGLAEDFQPISDMRASAEYRSRIARNLLMRFYLETTGQAGRPAEATHA